MMRLYLISAMLLLLNGCSLFPSKPTEAYRLAKMQHLHNLEHWYLEGRLGLINPKDSISASLSWRHEQDADTLELVGPLAQGRVSISLSAGKVVIDDGDKPQEYHGDVDAVMFEQLGVDVPVAALKYWVLGTTDPRQAYSETANGFVQDGWVVSFAEMQSVDSEILPRKITAMKDRAKVKLVVDKWDVK